MQILGKFEKQPAEILDYDVDYSEWFGDRQDTPDLYTTQVDAGLTLVSHQLVGNAVKLVLGGGAAGEKYKVQVRLTTMSGLVKEADFILKIKEV